MALANSSNQIQANTPSGLSLKALKEAIPDDCFQPALVTSLGYLLRDLVYAGILGYCAISFIHTIPNTWLQIVAWALYGFLQGCVGVGLWILAHECGHGAFSLHPRLNDMIGWIVHSTLLVPYFSWKITHARHHRFTGHMAKDTAFVPYTEAEYRARFPKIFAKMAELFEDTPLMTCISLLGHQIFGWPAYLVFSVSAGRSSAPVKMSKLTGESRSHLDPFSMLFTASQQWYIFLSDIGLGIMVYFLVYVAGQIGTKDILLLYFLPYLWVNHWIVAITYLHHTHPNLPHYAEYQWTYIKGAIATVDRTTGFIGRHFFHDIIDFHVIHHLFPQIPFYRAEEATRAAQPILGHRYHEQKDVGFMTSFVETFQACKFVSEGDGLIGGGDPGIFHWKLKKITSVS